MTEPIKKPADSDLSAVPCPTLGYALCKCWKDNPNDLAVHDYYDTLEEAKAAKAAEKKKPNFFWVIAEYK